jgi:hypothetical protein
MGQNRGKMAGTCLLALEGEHQPPPLARNWVFRSRGDAPPAMPVEILDVLDEGRGGGPGTPQRVDERAESRGPSGHTAKLRDWETPVGARPSRAPTG